MNCECGHDMCQHQKEDGERTWCHACECDEFFGCDMTAGDALPEWDGD